jgi:hypothetical protein
MLLCFRKMRTMASGRIESSHVLDSTWLRADHVLCLLAVAARRRSAVNASVLVENDSCIVECTAFYNV